MKSIVAILFSITALVPGQGVSRLENGPKITLSVKTTKVSPGKTGKGVVSMQFADGWHGYQNPPTKDYQIPVSLSANKALGLKVTYPVGQKKMTMGEESAVYEGAVSIPFTFVAPAKLGKQVLKITVIYQQCDSNSCLPPSSVEVKCPYTVVKAKS